ncbi:MAG: YheU family protein [Pseudomonadales bacterium]
MIIPADRLSKDALHGLIEEFISREGTDYGTAEYDLKQKTQHVVRQMERGEVVVVFDAASDSCNLLVAEEAQLFSAVSDAAQDAEEYEQSDDGDNRQ